MKAEYEVVREGGAGVIDLSARGRIRVAGSEAVMFLNGLITNDMKTLAENRWMPAAFPTVQGRLIGAVRVARTAASFLIDTDAESHEAVLKTISRFTLAGDFKVTDLTEQTALLTIQGAGAIQMAAKVLGSEMADLPRDGVIELEWKDTPVTVIRATHTAEDGVDVVIDSDHAAELGQAFFDSGAQPVSAEAFETLRVEAGIARYGHDMDESNVVTETNLDDAVSFTKGCYLGQEVIVRIRHRGHVAKKLTGLRFDTEQKIESGTIVKSDEKEVGRVTSAVFSPKLRTTIALGYVRYEHLNPGTTLTTDNNIAATVTELPFIRGSWYQDNG
jgi:aminomethyltransferase